MGSIESGGLVFADGLVVGMLTGSPDGGRTFRPMRQGGVAPISRRAIITGRFAEGGSRWRYEVRFAVGPHSPDGWELDPDSVPFSAYQPLEGEAVPGTLASGINTNNLQGFIPVSLPVGAKVIVDRVDGEWYIRATQAIDGSCPDGGAP